MASLTLGTSTAIAPLGIGTWAWGDTLFWNYGKDYSAAELQESFKTALELGVNFFDTAEIYGFGESERLLGRFKQQAPEAPVQIATKYFPLPWRFNAGAVADALTASLKRLQVASVPLYQVHWPLDFLMSQKTLMDAMADEVQQGRIGAIGVSNYSVEQMQKAHKFLAARGIPLAANQVQYSLLARQIEHNGVMAAARDLGVVILAYSPLAQGLVTGKYTVENYQPPTGARKLDPRFSRQGLEKLAPVIQELKAIGAVHGKTPAQVALNWLIAQGNVMVIPGAKSAEQVRQNAGALGWEMTAEELGRVDTVTQNWKA
jgi:aryl-alcohol dehydrogenase-like predicted oxidoreductase